MADVITRLRLESTEYDGKLKRAVAQMGQMEQQVRRTGATFAYADKEELAFVQSLGQMSTKATTAKQQLREYTDAITSLTATYRAMTAEEQNSEFGKAMAQSIEELKVKAAGLQDVMADTQSEIKRLASDTSAFDQLTGGITTVVAAFQVAQGAMQMFGVKNEEAMQAMAKLQAMIAVTSGLTKIQASLQKESAVMIGIATLQKKAAAAAENLDTAAKGKNIIVTKAATIAQRALNAAAMANPYVLLAMAVVGVGAALVGFSRHSKAAAKAAEEERKAIERQQEANKKVAESIGTVVGKYNRLKTEWQNLSTEQEKRNWIEENKTAFNDLGLSINNVVDADNAFVNSTDKVIAALKARAKANALKDLYEENVKKIYADAANIEKGHRYTAGESAESTFAVTDRSAAGIYNNENLYETKSTYGEDYVSKSKTFTEEGARIINERLDQLHQQAIDEAIATGMESVDAMFGSMYTEALKEANDAEAATGGLVGGGKKTTNATTVADEILPPGSIAELRKRIQQVQKEWEMATTDEGRNEKAGQLKTLQDELDRLTGKAKTAAEAMQGISGYSENALSARRSDLKSSLSSQELGSEGYQIDARTLVDLDTFSNLLRTAAENGLQLDESVVEGMLTNIDMKVDVTDDEWQAFVDTINEKLAALDLPPIELDVKTGNVKELNTEAKDTMKHVNGAAAAFQALGNAMDQIDDPGAKVAGLIAQSIGSVVAGYGAATAQAATMGPWAWIAFALTGLATMISMVAGIKSASAGSYADGGIIPGNSLSGDNLLASVNSQELVLNRAQTSNLANQLTEGGINNLQLETRIKGNDLRVVLANNDRQRGGGNRGAYAISK